MSFPSIAKSLFLLASRPVLKTPPIAVGSHDFTLLSMIGHGHVIPYLLAVKSFVHFGPAPQHICLLDDGSLHEKDKEILYKHIPFLTIRAITDIPKGPYPSGGCWERLWTAIDLSKTRYTIQLDSDTLSVQPLPLIATALRDNRPFLLATHGYEHIEPTSATSRRAQAIKSAHVQISAEKTLAESKWQGRFYLRASAGFAGFPKQALSHQDMIDFSSALEDKLGADHWANWGSEQVASNALLANLPQPVILSEPDFVNHSPESTVERAHFIHFIGSHRYKAGTYRRLSRIFLKQAYF